MKLTRGTASTSTATYSAGKLTYGSPNNDPLRQSPQRASPLRATPKESPPPARKIFSSVIRSILNLLTRRWLSLPSRLAINPTSCGKVAGTLFGPRRGLVSFAVQVDPGSEPILLIELGISTATLAKEISGSGLVRIALECEKASGGSVQCRKLVEEPAWKMCCNGRNFGVAFSRSCGESDYQVLSAIQSVTDGAGVVPVVREGWKSPSADGEFVYLRAEFERVVGSRDSEAFHMASPDGDGGAELSVFLLRT